MEPCAADSQPVVAEVVTDRAQLAVAEATPALAKWDEQADRLRAIEDNVLHRGLSCLHDVGCWKDIDRNQADTDYPAEWVEELNGDPVALAKRMRVAKAAWMSAKEAPVAIKVAQSAVVGIAKARATEKGGGTTLSIQTVNFVAPRYEVIEVASEDG